MAFSYGFYDKVPHFSTFGKNYERRFKDTDLFEQIFYRILKEASDKKLISSEHIFIDSTHVKASANKHKFEKKVVRKETKAYEARLQEFWSQGSIRNFTNKLETKIYFTRIYELKKYYRLKGANGMDLNGGLDTFNIIETIFPIFFILIAGFILFTIFSGISEWSSNNKQPRLKVDAVVVSKRTRVNISGPNRYPSTKYYVTFQVESGDRMELGLNGREFGQLAEGDVGGLEFQGTRYHGFTRKQPSA